MDYKLLNECIKISKEYKIYDECITITNDKFDINKFRDKVNWYSVSSWQTLSEEFIREFKDEVDWYSISWFQILSEEFIIEFKDKVNWSGISEHQKLSEEFICENLDNIEIYWLFINNKINLTKEFKDKIRVLKMLIG